MVRIDWRSRWRGPWTRGRRPGISPVDSFVYATTAGATSARLTRPKIGEQGGGEFATLQAALPTTGAVQLPRKPNYDFEKRKKELDRKAKKDAKLRNKRDEAARAREESEGPADQDATPAPE